MKFNKENINVNNIIEKIDLPVIKRRVKKIMVGGLVLTIIGSTGLVAYVNSNINYSKTDLANIAIDEIGGKIVATRMGIEDETLSLKYEFEIKDENNKLNEIELDTRTGAIIDIDKFGYNDCDDDDDNDDDEWFNFID